MAWWEWHSQVTFRNGVSLFRGQIVVKTLNDIWQGLKKRATFWFYVKLITAKPKIASYLLHWSNYTDVFKTSDSQENKNKILEIAMHIKQ